VPPPIESIDVRPAECPSTVDWKLSGKVELGEIARQLSANFCEGYFIPKDLIHQKVDLILVPTPDAREMQRRVLGALRGLGYDTDRADFWFVKKVE
jgi:hypothetical protein